MRSIIALAIFGMGMWFFFWPPFQPTNAQIFGWLCVILVWVIGSRQHLEDQLKK